jgi:hypothetical protein
MTDHELDMLTERAMTGELTEAEYNRLTQEAIENGKALLANPEALAKATANPFVPAPGEATFRAFCVRRGNGYVGQFSSKSDVLSVKQWAIGNLPGYRGCRVRTLNNFLPTLGHPVYELKVFVVA